MKMIKFHATIIEYLKRHGNSAKIDAMILNLRLKSKKHVLKTIEKMELLKMIKIEGEIIKYNATR